MCPYLEISLLSLRLFPTTYIALDVVIVARRNSSTYTATSLSLYRRRKRRRRPLRGSSSSSFRLSLELLLVLAVAVVAHTHTKEEPTNEPNQHNTLVALVEARLEEEEVVVGREAMDVSPSSRRRRRRKGN